MDSRIGAVLREARIRRKIDLSEVETATRIRLRFLHAIENEEWDVLPGGVYTRGFIRTYAAFLGLDGERLAEDYRESVEGGRGGPAEPAPIAVSGSGLAGPSRLSTALGGWIAVATAILLVLIAIVAIPDGDDGSEEAPGEPSPQQSSAKEENQNRTTSSATPSRGVSVRLTAGAEVWVCMLDAEGSPLVNGQILEAGAQEGPFHSGSFTVSFGNGEIAMLIDGEEADIPATSSPIGYAIDSSGALTELGETERPTCT
ncbi:MAG TPA: helix-turn-helix domain-containing protein [Solirubrobacterales bacterium]|nr:helix-turn-helix domain-containing protein [Solirubrobacterales bacterium]